MSLNHWMVDEASWWVTCT